MVGLPEADGKSLSPSPLREPHLENLKAQPSTQPWLRLLQRLVDARRREIGCQARPIKLASACTGLASEGRALTSLGFGIDYLYGSDLSG